jgi:hypothetical protein
MNASPVVPEPHARGVPPGRLGRGAMQNLRFVARLVELVVGHARCAATQGADLFAQTVDCAGPKPHRSECATSTNTAQPRASSIRLDAIGGGHVSLVLSRPNADFCLMSRKSESSHDAPKSA